MDILDQKALDEIIDKHTMFIKGDHGGARAVCKFHDLSGLDFKSADLSNADFTGSKLDRADMGGCKLQNCSFFACDMRKTNLAYADLSRSDMRGAHIVGADLTEATFEKADFRQGIIFNYQHEAETFNWQQSGETVLSGSIIRNTDMTYVMAQGANFSESNMEGLIIQDANLSMANLSGANLTNADFTGADLSGSKTKGAIIDNTVFRSAKASQSDILKTVEDQNKKKSLSRDGISLKKLIQMHLQWVETAGKEGKQLHLVDYDLSDELDLKAQNLTAIVAMSCRFTGLNLERAFVQSSNLDSTDFRDCNMRAADFRGSSCKNSIFTRANLIDANFSALVMKRPDGSDHMQRSNLENAKLAYADMDNSNFSNAILKNADLSYASLVNCDLSGADLTGANLDSADLTGANLEDAIMDDKVSDPKKLRTGAR